jgi:predicted DCC family thiol-disulfide oxidoreductase YuxK
MILGARARELLAHARANCATIEPLPPERIPEQRTLAPCGGPAAGRAALLYDEDCGFCRCALRAVLAWDRRGRLRAVAIQDREGERLLAGMGAEERMDSWHLADANGSLHSAGAALAPLLRMLRGGAPLAAAAEAFPALAERSYRAVADHRAGLHRVLERLGVC